MKIEPKVGPSIHQATGITSESSDAARSRAIAMLSAQAANASAEVVEAAVVNPSSESVANENRQNNNAEGESPVVADASLAEPKEEKAAAEKPLSSEYAILARKEKALRAKDQQIRAREVAIKAAEDAKNAPVKPVFDESKYISKDKLQNDLFGTLTEMGLTYDQITAQATNAPTPEQVALNQELKSLRDELKAIRGEQESTKKSWEEQQTESYRQAVNQIKNEASLLVNHNPDFETIKETGSINDVVELIERTFKEDGTLLTVEEAAKEVEDYLVEEALKISRIKKIQQRLNASAAPAAALAKPTEAPKQQQMKTLTNSVSSTRQLSSRERAILAAQRKL